MIGWLRRLPTLDSEKQHRASDALGDYPPYSPPPWNADKPLEYKISSVTSGARGSRHSAPSWQNSILR
jgi:hypothetical protein